MCRILKLFCLPCARLVDFVSRLFLCERVNSQVTRARVALRLRLYVAIIFGTAGLSCLILTTPRTASPYKLQRGAVHGKADMTAISLRFGRLL
jgi:hypothetical protein